MEVSSQKIDIPQLYYTLSTLSIPTIDLHLNFVKFAAINTHRINLLPKISTITQTTS